MNKVWVSVVVFCIMNAVVCGMGDDSTPPSRTLRGWFRRGLNTMGIYPVMSHQDYMRTTDGSSDGDYQARLDSRSKNKNPPVCATFPVPIEPKPDLEMKREESSEDSYRFWQDLLNHV